MTFSVHCGHALSFLGLTFLHLKCKRLLAGAVPLYITCVIDLVYDVPSLEEEAQEPKIMVSKLLRQRDERKIMMLLEWSLDGKLP